MAFDYLEDCIHLKACRRVQKIGKSLRLNVPRYCTKECSAYLSNKAEGYLTTTEAWRVAVDQYERNRDPYDVYAEWDFPSHTLEEIIEDAIEDAKEQ